MKKKIEGDSDCEHENMYLVMSSQGHSMAGLGGYLHSSSMFNSTSIQDELEEREEDRKRPRVERISSPRDRR